MTQSEIDYLADGIREVKENLEKIFTILEGPPAESEKGLKYQMLKQSESVEQAINMVARTNVRIEGIIENCEKRAKNCPGLNSNTQSDTVKADDIEIHIKPVDIVSFLKKAWPIIASIGGSGGITALIMTWLKNGGQ